MENESKTNIVFAIIGFMLAFLSKELGSVISAFILLAIVVFIAQKGLKKRLKIDEDFKWWLGNGVLLCILLWLVVWTILINV